MERRLFTEEHLLFRDSVQGFIDRHVAPQIERFRDEKGIDAEVWLEAGRQGMLGFMVPEEYGGGGISDYRFNAVFCEELSRFSLALGSTLGIHTDVVAPYLVDLATAEQRERWLPGFCAGTLRTAIAMTEPGAGSDLAAIQTRAQPDGAGWVVNGSKTFVTNGASADLVISAVRTGDRPSDITLFLVGADSPGFSRGTKLDKIGQPEADTGELFYDEVRLGPEHVLGEVGKGFAYMMERLPQERLHSACVNTAHAAAVLQETLVYVRDRRAFGQPIGSFQANRFLLAELATGLDVTQAFVDRCIEEHVANRLDPLDAAKAKWWSAEMQNRLIDHCLQLHGGYGYMREYGVARAWLDARITKIWAGSNEIMKEVIGRSLGLGDPRRPS